MRQATDEVGKRRKKPSWVDLDLDLDLVYFIDLNVEPGSTEYRDLQADCILIYMCNSFPDGTGHEVINSNN